MDFRKSPRATIWKRKKKYKSQKIIFESGIWEWQLRVAFKEIESEMKEAIFGRFNFG